jgi:hypothetical protein
MEIILKKMTLQSLGVWMGMLISLLPGINVLQYLSHDFLSDEDIRQLDVVRDLFLGPPEEMLSSSPIENPNKPGSLIGGTAFERCGQIPVKGSGRCYSLTMTHQRQKALVGPTAALKQYDLAEDDDIGSLNLEIRGKVTKVRISSA